MLLMGFVGFLRVLYGFGLMVHSQGKKPCLAVELGLIEQFSRFTKRYSSSCVPHSGSRSLPVNYRLFDSRTDIFCLQIVVNAFKKEKKGRSVNTTGVTDETYREQAYGMLRKRKNPKPNIMDRIMFECYTKLGVYLPITAFVSLFFLCSDKYIYHTSYSHLFSGSG